MDEKTAAVDRLSAIPDESTVIACQVVTPHSYVRPGGVYTSCMTCDELVSAWPVTLERKKHGAYIVCRPCFSKLVAIWNQKGTCVKFEGRIRQNKFPGGE